MARAGADEKHRAARAECTATSASIAGGGGGRTRDLSVAVLLSAALISFVLFGIVLSRDRVGPFRAAIARAPPQPEHQWARGLFPEQLSAHLRVHVKNAWYPRSVDTTNGGFATEFRQDWSARASPCRTTEAQLAHVWVCAKLAHIFPRDRKALLEAAARAFEFARVHLWDAERGGFVHAVRPGGTRVKDGRTCGYPTPDHSVHEKSLSANALAVFALVGYYEAAGNESALQLAQDTYHWLNVHSHDPRFGGFLQELHVDGSHIEATEHMTQKDAWGNLQLLEAVTQLYRVSPDAEIKATLLELLYVTRMRLVTALPGVAVELERDMTPIPYNDTWMAETRAWEYRHDVVSFGTNLRAARLLVEGSRELGLGTAEALDVAASLVSESFKWGWDHSKGGFYDAGVYVDRDNATRSVIFAPETKPAWVQAEAMSSLLLMACRSSSTAPYLQRLQALWKYINTYLVDSQYGGWFSDGLDRSPAAQVEAKASVNKTSFYEAHAIIRSLELLRDCPAIPQGTR